MHGTMLADILGLAQRSRLSASDWLGAIGSFNSTCSAPQTDTSTKVTTWHFSTELRLPGALYASGSLKVRANSKASSAAWPTRQRRARAPCEHSRPIQVRCRTDEEPIRLASC